MESVLWILQQSVSQQFNQLVNFLVNSKFGYFLPISSFCINFASIYSKQKFNIMTKKEE